MAFCYSLAVRPRWLSWVLTPILRRVFARYGRRLEVLKDAVEHRRRASTIALRRMDRAEPGRVRLKA